MDDPRLKYFGPGPAGEDHSHAPRSSARIEGGVARHLRAHLRRLETTALALGHPAPWLGGEETQIADWLRSVAVDTPQVLRLRLLGDALLARVEELPPMPSPYLLKPMPHPLGLSSANPLAPHKGATGMWGAALLPIAQGFGADDALLHWPDGTFVETAIASIGLEVERELWLPMPEGRIASLAERLDLPAWAANRNLSTTMRAFDIEDISRGTLWCFNAVRGQWSSRLV